MKTAINKPRIDLYIVEIANYIIVEECHLLECDAV
jgi:hypothetical protein